MSLRQDPESDVDRVIRYRQVLDRKSPLRLVYLRWYKRIRESLSAMEPTVEIGTGHGMVRDIAPHVLATDIFPSPFTHLVCDAMDLPFNERSVGNFMMVDVLHHIHNPVRAFAEMARCLKRGGRIVVSEPYLSPIAKLAFRFHFERVDFAQELAGAGPPTEGLESHPFEGNMALSHKALISETAKVLGEVPSMTLRSRVLSDWLVYPLSGGFNFPSLVPGWAVPTLDTIEQRLPFLAPYAGFKVTVVFEKID